jgi:hypothetical protein
VKGWQWKAALVAFTLFALGVVAGAALTRALAVRQAVRVLEHDPVRGPRRLYIWALTKKLDLSDEDRARIEAVFERHDEELRDVRRSIEPRLSALRRTLEDEIVLVLPEAQRDPFRALRREDEERYRRAIGAP